VVQTIFRDDGRMTETTALLLAAALAVNSTGCATIFNSDKATIQVSSATPGAQVLVDGAPAGYTPTFVTVDAHESHVIVVRNAAGQETGCRLDASAGVGWLVVDLLFLFWPIVIDLVTGAHRSVDETPCVAGV
jgi:hypothetical protein